MQTRPWLEKVHRDVYMCVCVYVERERKRTEEGKGGSSVETKGREAEWKRWIETVPPYIGTPGGFPPPARPATPTSRLEAAVLRFSTFSRFIPAASSLNRFPGEIYGRGNNTGGRVCARHRERERERERKRRRVTVREPVTCIPGTFAGFFSTWLTASTSSPSTFFTTIHHLPPLHAPRKPRLDYFGPVRALYISFLRRLLAGELLVPWDFMRTAVEPVDGVSDRVIRWRMSKSGDKWRKRCMMFARLSAEFRCIIGGTVMCFVFCLSYEGLRVNTFTYNSRF